ncbi:hypothetical protein VTG60DRAFT_4309 [Thermothelomyces hinnuleus]
MRSLSMARPPPTPSFPAPTGQAMLSPTALSPYKSLPRLLMRRLPCQPLLSAHPPVLLVWSTFLWLDLLSTLTTARPTTTPCPPNPTHRLPISSVTNFGFGTTEIRSISCCTRRPSANGRSSPKATPARRSPTMTPSPSVSRPPPSTLKLPGPSTTPSLSGGRPRTRPSAP